jgi:ComF family protein
MSSFERLRWVASFIEDIVFPPMCAGCRKRGSWLCDACRDLLQPIPRPICYRCGQPTADTCLTCENCRTWPDRIGSFRAAFRFGGPIRESVHRFKYQGEFARAADLSNLMFRAIYRTEFVELPAWDCIAFVPLHPRRRRQRGFDQSALLSRHLSDLLDIPRLDGLVRSVDTPSQVGRGEDERRSNVRGAFEWQGNGGLSGTRILLIDDVVTTGATMLAAAETLLGEGALRVDGFALARELLA